MIVSNIAMRCCPCQHCCFWLLLLEGSSSHISVVFASLFILGDAKATQSRKPDTNIESEKRRLGTKVLRCIDKYWSTAYRQGTRLRRSVLLCTHSLCGPPLEARVTHCSLPVYPSVCLVSTFDSKTKPYNVQTCRRGYPREE